MAKKKTPKVLTPEEYEYKHLGFDDIANWCIANNQLAWLEAELEKDLPTKDKETGKPVFDENGKPITHKTTFVELKVSFADTFRPEIAPKRDKVKPLSMAEKLAKLKEEAAANA